MAKTDWQMNDTVRPEDMNQIGQEINQNRDDLAAHTAATTGVHGATSAATANTIIQRDPAGRAKVAAPAAADDIARKDTVDAVQTNLNNHIADYVRQPGYAVASGSANAYSVTLSPAPSAYVDGMAVAVKINVTNTGASTLNVNGLGAKAIKKSNGNDVAAGNLKAGSIYTFRYNANTGNFILQAEGSGGTAQPADVLIGKTFTNDQGEQVGTMPNRTGHVTGQSISRSGTTLRIRPQQGHYPGDSGNSVAWNDPNWIAENILEGVSIFGLNGSLVPGKKFAVGRGTTDGSNFLTVNGLSFSPKVIIVIQPGTTNIALHVNASYAGGQNSVIDNIAAIGGQKIDFSGYYTSYPDGFKIACNMNLATVDWIAFDQ